MYWDEKDQTLRLFYIKIIFLAFRGKQHCPFKLGKKINICIIASCSTGFTFSFNNNIE